MQYSCISLETAKRKGSFFLSTFLATLSPMIEAAKLACRACTKTAAAHHNSCSFLIAQQPQDTLPPLCDTRKTVLWHSLVSGDFPISSILDSLAGKVPAERVQTPSWLRRCFLPETSPGRFEKQTNQAALTTSL